MGSKFYLWLALLLTAITPVRADTLNFPPLTGQVVDAAHILSPAQAAGLTSKLQAIAQTTGHQLAVATIPDLQGRDIADYGYQLGRSWGIGTKAKNDGLLIIIAPTEHKVRIEVGYGLEPIVTDALSSVIITHKMTPAFKQGDYAGGLNAGVDALNDLLKLPPDEAAARAKAIVAADAQNNQVEQGHPSGGNLIFWVIFILIFVVPALFGRSRGGSILPFMMLGGFGGGYSGGSSDGGGFSGGGGSFGGGGASGGW